MAVKNQQTFIESDSIKNCIFNEASNSQTIKIILQEEWNSLAAHYFPNLAPEKTKADNLIYWFGQNMDILITKILEKLDSWQLFIKIIIENLKRLLMRFYLLRQIHVF